MKNDEEESVEEADGNEEESINPTPTPSINSEIATTDTKHDEDDGRTPRDDASSIDSEEPNRGEENLTLRRRLIDSGRGFQHRLDQQTNLMSRLQDQLKDSQKRMADMEAAERSAAMGNMSTASLASPARGYPATSTPRKSALDPSSSVSSSMESSDERMLKRLLEEQERNVALNEANSTLRRELDDTKVTAVSLTGDLLRVTHEFDRTKRDTSTRLEEYKKNEKLYLERLSSEHRQMLKLWRSFQQLRREYLDCRSVTKRNLSSIDSELQRVCKGSTTACQKMAMWMSYEASSKILNGNTSDEANKTEGAASSVEEMILDNVRRLTEGQNEKEETIRRMQQRLDELIEQKQLLESQVIERDRQLELIRLSEPNEKNDKDDSIDFLHSALRDLIDRAQASANHQGPSASPSSAVSPRRRARSFSPSSRGRSAAAELTLKMVEDAFGKKMEETNEATTRLRAVQQKLADAEKQLSIGAADRTEAERLEKELGEAQAKVVCMQKEHDTALRSKESLKAQFAYIKNEILPIEKKKRETIEAQMDGLNKDLEEAQKLILHLESTNSTLEDERDRLVEASQRHKSELVKLKSLLDSTQSTLNESRDETADARSTVNRLERELRETKDDCATIKTNLDKAEAKCGELEKELARVTNGEQSINDRLSVLVQEKQFWTKDREEMIRERQLSEKRMERLEDEYVEMERKKESIELELKTSKDELDAYKQLESDWNHERTLLVAQLESRGTDLHEFENQLNSFKIEHVQTSQELKTALEKQRDLETQLETCRRDLNDEHEKSISFVEERQHLITEHHELKERTIVMLEQIHRFEEHEKQMSENYRTRLLELERRLDEAEEEKKTSENLILDLTRRVEDAQEEKRSAESRTNSLQAVLISQEELLRAKETEKRNVQSRLAQLEGQLRGRESQLKQLSEKYETLKVESEKTTMDHRELKTDFDRTYEDRQRFKSEVHALNSDVQKLRTLLQEALLSSEETKEQAQSITERLRTEEQRRVRLQSEVDQLRTASSRAEETERDLRIQLESKETLLNERSTDTQSSREQLLDIQQKLRTSEQERRMLEERLKDAKDQLSKSKKDSKLRSDELTSTQEKLADSERKLVEIESQLKSLQKMLSISQETESDLKRQLENAVSQKQTYQKRFAEFQRLSESFETQKREWANKQSQLERDLANANVYLNLHLEEIKKNEAALEAAIRERESMDISLKNMEKENIQLHKTASQLQSQVTRMEQTLKDRQSEVQRHNSEYEIEFQRLQSAYDESTRKYALLEKTYERRLKEKEEEIKRLNERLRVLDRARREYTTSSMRSHLEVADIRAGISNLNHDLETSVFLARNNESLMSASLPGSPARQSTPRKNLNATASGFVNNHIRDAKK